MILGSHGGKKIKSDINQACFGLVVIHKLGLEKGQLVTERGIGYTNEYTHNKFGEIATEKRRFLGAVYTTAYQRTLSGQMSRIIYPDGSQVHYSYNDAGDLTRVGKTAGGQDYIKDIRKNKDGMRTRTVFGNGTENGYEYHPDRRSISWNRYPDITRHYLTLDFHPAPCYSAAMKKRLRRIHDRLLAEYGPQGWWPLYDGRRGRIVYRPGQYEPPRTKAKRFEIALGVILTQNTTWESAVRAMDALRSRVPLSPEALLDMDTLLMEETIRPARYPRQKARYIREVSSFFRKSGIQSPSRETLRAVPGIGPESADSLLLYAFGIPAFIADAYSRRIFAALGLIPETAGYEALRERVEPYLPDDPAFANELHALLVVHGSRLYSRRPYGEGDRLLLSR